MKHETFKDMQIVSPLVTQINLLISNQTNTIEEKEFYIRMCIKENYAKRKLERAIASSYFQRHMN